MAQRSSGPPLTALLQAVANKPNRQGKQITHSQFPFFGIKQEAGASLAISDSLFVLFTESTDARCAPPGNEYLAIANLAGMSTLGDRFNTTLDIIIYGNDQIQLRAAEIDDIFGTAIEFRVPLLAAKPSTSDTVMPLIPISPMLHGHHRA